MENTSKLEKVITINEIASAMGKKPVETTLPNGRVVNGISWEPSDLPSVYTHVAAIVASDKLGRDDLVTIDGAAPIWMYVCITHALHPVSVQVNYPQGGCTLPVSGYTPAAASYICDGVTFTTNVVDGRTYVMFEMDSPAIDVANTLSTLTPIAVLPGGPVALGGRAPAALYCAVADAYAHLVPYVAVYQPGTGNVVAISHSAVPLGTIV